MQPSLATEPSTRDEAAISIRQMPVPPFKVHCRKDAKPHPNLLKQARPSEHEDDLMTWPR